MGLYEFNPRSKARRERALIYSFPGFGKTRLATSLPPTEKWGEVLYFPADPGSEFLDSVLPRYRDKIHVLASDGKDGALLNSTEFALRNWREPYPKAKTIIIDTYTTLMFDVLRDCANTGAMTQETHYRYGPKGNAGSIALPNRSDYFAIQGVSRNLLDLLFLHQKDMHIIFVMHEDMTQVEGVGGIGGPSHPGRQLALELPAKFNTVIRLTKETALTSNGDVKTAIFANTSSHGNYVAKLRECNDTGNPMPRVELEYDPVNFWNKYDSFDFQTRPEPVTAGGEQ